MGKSRKNRRAIARANQSFHPTPATPGGIQTGRGSLVGIQYQEHSGPLPHPSILEGYEKTLPGLAERIVKSAEKQTDHRIEMEKKVVDSKIKHEYLGWLSASVLALVVVLSGLYLVYLQRNLEGFGTLVGTGLLYASLFKEGRSAQRKELAEKRGKLES